MQSEKRTGQNAWIGSIIEDEFPHPQKSVLAMSAGDAADTSELVDFVILLALF